MNRFLTQSNLFPASAYPYSASIHHFAIFFVPYFDSSSSPTWFYAPSLLLTFFWVLLTLSLLFVRFLFLFASVLYVRAWVE